eukprot:scaffold1522_cov166-Amphora_coffeaeformis.AAC.32
MFLVFFVHQLPFEIVDKTVFLGEARHSQFNLFRRHSRILVVGISGVDVGIVRGLRQICIVGGINAKAGGTERMSNPSGFDSGVDWRLLIGTYVAHFGYLFLLLTTCSASFFLFFCPLSFGVRLVIVSLSEVLYSLLERLFVDVNQMSSSSCRYQVRTDSS